MANNQIACYLLKLKGQIASQIKSKYHRDDSQQGMVKLGSISSAMILQHVNNCAILMFVTHAVTLVHEFTCNRTFGGKKDLMRVKNVLCVFAASDKFSITEWLNNFIEYIIAFLVWATTIVSDFTPLGESTKQ